MVTRRITITKSFERKIEDFHQPAFVGLVAEILEKGKSFNKSAISASLIYNYINENKDLWKIAFEVIDKIDPIEQVVEREGTSEFRELIEKNTYTLDTPSESEFLSELLMRLLNPKVIPYSGFEKEILGVLVGKEKYPDNELIQEAVKAFASSLYKEDPETSFRFIFEEYLQNANSYKDLGIRFIFPKLNVGLGNVSRLIESVFTASRYISGVLEFNNLIRVINRFSGTYVDENEIYDFFTSYLGGSLDHILLNPPWGKKYFSLIEKTIDYEHEVNLNDLTFPIEFNPEELTPVFSKLINILTRVKVYEWSKNYPIGKEPTILDLLLELQSKLKIIINDSNELISLESMFTLSNQNVIELAIEHYAKKITYSLLLRITKGGIEKPILDSFKNLSGAPKGLGNQIIAIKEYYLQVNPDSWEKTFFHEYVLKTASKGLSTATKRTVTDRINLLVQSSIRSKEKTKHYEPRKIQTKVKSEEIFDALRMSIPSIKPVFQTSDEAEAFLNRSFTLIKSELNKSWLKTILRKGFELYIEQPVAKAWTNEMEDLSREFIHYYKDLQYLESPQLEISELIVESLREALELPSLGNIDDQFKDQEVLKLFLKLPENYPLLNQGTIEKFLNSVFNHSKKIINSVLRRNVEEEIERKTFNQEIDERISLENKIIDQFVRASHSYAAIITEPISLERTADPNDLLLKTLYGGVIFLIEESMKSLNLTSNQKNRKAVFFRDLFLREINELKMVLSRLNIDYNLETIIGYSLEQISLWNSVFGLRSFLIQLGNDNRFQKALGYRESTGISEFGNKNGEHSVIIFPGVRSLISRELISPWIKKWANSVINLGDSVLEDYLGNKDITPTDQKEQEVLSSFFDATGRNDIRNFLIPFIIGNVSEATDFESCSLPSDFQKYSHEVFADAVPCDSQIAVLSLFENWGISQETLNFYFHKHVLKGEIDFICYQGSSIQSSRQLLGSRELCLSDVVKKATGLNLSGLKLETLIYQFGDRSVFSAASYVENPFEESQITGLTLELMFKETIPIGVFHPLAENASRSFAGLIERNPQNSSNPDSLYQKIVQQLLGEAELILLKDVGPLKDILHEKSSQESLGYRDISRTTLKVTTAYLLHFEYVENEPRHNFLPKEVEFWGENLLNFNLFTRLLIPFFEPGKIIKEKLCSDKMLMSQLGIPKHENLEGEMIFPSLIIFDEGSLFKVVFAYRDSSVLKILIAEESKTSKMGIRTIQYLLKTSEFEDLVADFGLFPLPELNGSLPLNRIRVLIEKDDQWSLDHRLIKNISLGAI
jgi:hypothetical protein